MKIQTFSIVAGSEACNARCPFCISKMTVPHGVTPKEPEVNWRNFHKACELARSCGVTTAMLTGKGEPTLFPNQITRYLEEMREFAFPLIEVQTNGIPFMDRPDEYGPHLDRWHDLGLTLFAVSVVHHDPEKNRQIYLPHRERYIDLPELVARLKGRGFSLRLACVMAQGFVDSPEELEGLIGFARSHGVEQLTVRPVNKPDASRSDEAATWAAAHALPDESLASIVDHLENRGHRLMTLMHGAVVYDVGGQNVCLTDSLTIESTGEDLRQLIFFPDGHLRYDWQYPGAVLL